MKSIARLPFAVPGIAWTAWRVSRVHARSFAVAIEPMLAREISGVAQLPAVRQALLEWSIKGGYLIDAYVRLARLPAPRDLMVMGAVAARLYDDLLDDTTRAGFAERTAKLFCGGVYEPMDDLERLHRSFFFALYAEVADDGRAPIMEALLQLHRAQTISLLQRGGFLAPERLREVTERKGALTMEVLFALVHPSMSGDEREIIHAIGRALQLLDDYVDAEVDRHVRIATVATCGGVGFADLVRRLDDLEFLLSGSFGRRRARRFVDEMRVILCMGAMNRWWPARMMAWSLGSPVFKCSPLGILMRRGRSAA